MTDALRPAPYRSRHGYVPLAAYREAGLDDRAYFAQQFRVELTQTGPDNRRADRRMATIAPEVDRLPLQVKDLIRGALDEIRVAGDDRLDPGTLATWSNGVMTINGSTRNFDRPMHGPAALNASGSLLRTTLIHECGHILAEDPRGGVPLRHYLGMVAASGWLPDPRDDPVPYGAVGEELRPLTDHFARRLREVRPSWDMTRSLRDPALPGVAQFDRDMMGGPRATGGRRGHRATLGLCSPATLAIVLTSRYQRPQLEAELAAVSLSVPQVERALNRRGPISLYAMASIAEAPAELFAVLHRGRMVVRTEPEALREGQRSLCEPWLSAERSGPQRGLAPRVRVRHTRLVGRVADAGLKPTRGR
ncbi:MAG TPA: hypothetical protein VMW47_07380 [Verrucomicrobiae bacterium]|nr:hypothetical protein [Verrucomicrobiae bacterium]